MHNKFGYRKVYVLLKHFKVKKVKSDLFLPLILRSTWLMVNMTGSFVGDIGLAKGIDPCLTIDPLHEKSNDLGFTSREVSDQPGHPPSLITVC